MESTPTVPSAPLYLLLKLLWYSSPVSAQQYSSDRQEQEVKDFDLHWLKKIKKKTKNNDIAQNQKVEKEKM